MINILIVEDNINKAQKIGAALSAINDCKYELANDLVSARKSLKSYYDLMILDMNLPERFDEVPIENKGIDFIEEIQSSQRLSVPGNIIGLTEYENIFEKFRDTFEKKAISLIKFNITEESWQKTLQSKVEYIIQSASRKGVIANYDYDIAFITALRTPELDALLALDYEWQRLRITNDPSAYFRGKIELDKRQSLKVIATSLPQMGLVATASATTKMISSFRPRFIIMTGICAGIKGKVNLGDVIISDLSFDFGSGKIISKEGSEVFEPDFKAIPISGDYKEELIDLSQKTEILRSIKDKWMGNNIQTELNLRIGPLGSGAAVIAKEDFLDKVVIHQRKLLGIDMETYSIFYCCEYSSSPKPIPISIKGVCDYADSQKSDDLQKYSSFISANLTDYIIKNILFTSQDT